MNIFKPAATCLVYHRHEARASGHFPTLTFSHTSHDASHTTLLIDPFNLCSEICPSCFFTRGNAFKSRLRRDSWFGCIVGNVVSRAVCRGRLLSFCKLRNHEVKTEVACWEHVIHKLSLICCLLKSCLSVLGRLLFYSHQRG